MFSKKTRNLTIAVLALIMALTVSFGVLGFNTMKVDAAPATEISFASASGSGSSKKWGKYENSPYTFYYACFGTSATLLSGRGFKLGNKFALVFSLTENAKVTFDISSTSNVNNACKIYAYSLTETEFNTIVSKNASAATDYEYVPSSTATPVFSETNFTIKNTETKQLNLGKLAKGNYILYFPAKINSKASLDKITIAKVFTVDFSLDGGTGAEGESYAQKEYTEGGAALTLPANPSKTGYTFTGWKVGETTEVVTAATYTPTANVTLTAQWKENTPDHYVTVKDGATETKEGVYGSTYTLPAQKGDANEFIGWWNGTAFVEGTTMTVNADATITAVYAHLTAVGVGFRTGGTPGVRYGFVLEFEGWTDAEVEAHKNLLTQVKFTLSVCDDPNNIKSGNPVVFNAENGLKFEYTKVETVDGKVYEGLVSNLIIIDVKEEHYTPLVKVEAEFTFAGKTFTATSETSTIKARAQKAYDDGKLSPSMAALYGVDTTVAPATGA